MLLAAAAIASPCLAQAPVPPGAAAVPQVTLLQPGASPRQLLRLAPRVGASQVFDVTMRMEAAQTVDGREMTAEAIPGLRFSFRISVREIAPGGDVVYDAECVGADASDTPGADPELVQQARAGVQQLVGMRGNGRVTDRGINRGTSFDIPPGMDADLLPQVQTLERLLDQSAPLPLEPMGPGGSWQARMSLHEQRIPVTQTSVYTLKGFEGTTLLIDLKITQEAVIPAPAADEPVRMASYTSHGNGQIRLRLDQVFPGTASAEVVTESTWVARQGAAVQQMFQRSRMVMELAAGGRP